MIIKEHFLKKLRSAFDLNIYEVKIWTALLSRGIATAGELSDISNVPRSRSYDVLESLEKKGFIIMKLGKPIRYLAVEPAEVLKRVKVTIQCEADSRLQQIETVQEEDIFSELQGLFKTGIEHIEPHALSGSFKGRSGLYEHLGMLFSQAEKSVILVSTPEGVLRKLSHFRLKFKKLASKGVPVLIYTKVTDAVERAAKEFGTSFKLFSLETAPSRFCIVDDNDVVFMVHDDKQVHEEEDTGIWVKTPYFAQALQTMLGNIKR